MMNSIIGILEFWNDGILGFIELDTTPIFHYSNIPARDKNRMRHNNR